MSQSIAEALPAEIARVSGIRTLYELMGPAGGMAVAMMTADLTRAIKATGDGDVVEMLHAYQALKGWKE